MKGKRILAALLAGCMVTASLAGCGESTGGSSSGSTGSTATSGKVKLTALFVKHPLTKDVTKMKWLQQLEDKAGVEIEWQQISADWDQKKSAMFASGEIPDLLFNAVDSSGSDFVQYNGLFADMSSLIEKDAPNISQMFKDHPETKTLVTTTDSKIYATPSYQALWPKTNGTMYINKTWLDNLGLKVPTTWDELEQVLLAFKTKDANKNGSTSDEIPMDFNGFDGAYGLKNLLGSTGMQITGISPLGYFAEDGKIKNYYVDDRFKAVMKFVQKLYKEGLINKEAVTQDYSKFQSVARGSGKTAKVGFTWGWEAGDRFGNELKDQYVAIPQLKESTDTQKVCYSYDYYDLNYRSNSVAMSNQCKDKDAAMKFIDAFYDEKNSVQVLFGGMNDTDKGTKENSDGTYEVLAPADTSIDPGTWKWTNTFADDGPLYIRDEMKTKLKLGTDMQAVTKEKSVYDDVLNTVDPKKNVYPQQFMKYSQDDTNTLAMNQANITNITDQTWSTWMTNSNKNIDSEWSAFVASLNNAGLTKNLEIRQKAYDEYLKTVK